MARYNENECAHCAEYVEINCGLIGQDWKVYCCETCRTAGEATSLNEWQEWQRRIPIHSRHAPSEISTYAARC